MLHSERATQGLGSQHETFSSAPWWACYDGASADTPDTRLFGHTKPDCTDIWNLM